MSVLTKLNDSFNYLANKIKLLQSRPISSSNGGSGGISYELNKETLTGNTWIDGNPIYVQVFKNVLSSQLGARIQYKVGTILNIDQLLNAIPRFVIENNNTSIQNNLKGRVYYHGFTCYILNDVDLYIYSESVLPASIYYITVFYTKLIS